MTDTPKTMHLAPADWRQLCLLNVEQLGNYLASIPANTEGGLSALTPEHVVIIEGHLSRGRQFLSAWQRSRVPGMAEDRSQSTAEMLDGAQRKDEAHTPGNGVAEPQKRKGGWPRGKPRKPHSEAEMKQ